jgi:hypothetical protein
MQVDADRAAKIVEEARERFGNLGIGQSVAYVATIQPTAEGGILQPLPLDQVEGAQPREVDEELVFAVGRAIGFYGYIPHPDAPGPAPDPIELLRKGGRVPWQVLGPAVRNPDGQMDDGGTSCSGCLVCDCSGGSCACYCIHCDLAA